MEQCNGCRAEGRSYKDEPCCRCDSEQERKARLMDDPVLKALHNDDIMPLAVRYATMPEDRWNQGRVLGAITAWCTVALKVLPSEEWMLVQEVMEEYEAVIWGWDHGQD